MNFFDLSDFEHVFSVIFRNSDVIFLISNVYVHNNAMLFGQYDKTIFRCNKQPQKWDKWLFLQFWELFANFCHFGRGLSPATLRNQLQKLFYDTLYIISNNCSALQDMEPSKAWVYFVVNLCLFYFKMSCWDLSLNRDCLFDEKINQDLNPIVEKVIKFANNIVETILRQIACFGEKITTK